MHSSITITRTHHQATANVFSTLSVFPRIIWLFVLCGLIHGCAQKGNVTAINPVPQSGDADMIADAVPKFEPNSRLGNPSSYVVWGKRYYVMERREGFKERGIASWYGKKFHGRKTSSGEIYDMYAMTAAHKTLPLPAYVKVKNLHNKREIIVRVNDRGPFHPGRVIDLSYAAARKLGILRNGTARVEIQDVSMSSHKQIAKKSQFEPEQFTTDNSLYIQIGAFAERGNADRLSGDIAHPDLPAIRVTTDSSPDPVFRVQLGPLRSLAEAKRIKEHLDKQGITTSHLVFEPTNPVAPMIQ